MPPRLRRTSTSLGRFAPKRGTAWHRAGMVAVACGIAALASVISAYRVSVDPPGLHARAVQFSAAKGQVLVDIPNSLLVDPTYLWEWRFPQQTALNYALFLKTDQARRAAADAAGIQGQEISVSGPFNTFLGPPPVKPVTSSIPSPARVNANYRLVVDVAPIQPILDLYSQAPTTRAAVAIVDRMRALLSDWVSRQEAVVPVPIQFRAAVRSLGPTTGGVVDPGAPLELIAAVFCATLAAIGGLTIALRRRRRRRDQPVRRAQGEELGPRNDDWPHTKRVLPWLIAIFATMTFLVPVDAISLPVHLPLDSKPDRVVLFGAALLWLATLAIPRATSRPRMKLTGVHVALLVFLVLCCASIVLNGRALANSDEVTPVMKQLALLVSFIVFFVIAASVLRPGEVPRFSELLVTLGVIVAVGAIVERQTRYNVFYALWQGVLPLKAPAGLDGVDDLGRLFVAGPTNQPLELAALLALVVPFAIVGGLGAGTRRRRLLYLLATTVLVAGAISSYRKTGVVAPAAAILVLIYYRPRVMLRAVLVAGVPLLLAVHLIAPGQLGTVASQLLPGNVNNVNTTTHRIARYDAVRPDVMNHLLLGRGFASYDPHKYRVLDNEYLGLVIGVGFIGLLGYLAIFGSLLKTGHPMIRGPDRRRSDAALAAQGAIAAVVVSNALFDVLSFTHVSYMVLLVGAMTLTLREPSPLAPRTQVALAGGLA